MKNVSRSYIILFCVAVAVRLVWVGIMSVQERAIGPNPFPLLEVDSREYYQLASNMLSHGAFSTREEAPYEPNSNRVPAYPLFIAFVLLIFRSVYAISLLQAVVSGFITVGIAYFGFRFFQSMFVGVVAASVFAVEPIGVYYSSVAMSETLSIGLLLLALYVLFCTFENFRAARVYLFFAGLLLGILVLTRPIAQTLLIVFMGAVFWHFHLRTHAGWRRILVLLGIMACGVGVLIVPWMVRNQILFDSPSLSSVGSYNLYFYNARRFYVAKTGISESDSKEIFLRNLRAIDPSVPDDRVEFSLRDAPFAEKLALDYIGRYPMEYTIFHIKTLIPFFFTDGWREVFGYAHIVAPEYLHIREIALAGNISKALGILVEHRTSLFLFIVGGLFWAGVFCCACLGVFYGAMREQVRMQAVLFGVIIVVMAVSSGIVTTARFRYAIAPLLFLLAAYGAREVCAKIRFVFIRNS